MMTYDVLVAGGGIAGCVAAKTACDAGKNVAMIFSNGGASELSSGVLDVAGVVPGVIPKLCQTYIQGAELLAQCDPAHPYKLCLGSLKQGIEAACELAEKGGYPLYGFDGRNVWLPNIMGTFSVAAFVPEALRAAVASEEDERVLVVGFKGNVAFNAGSCAVSYQKYQKKLGFHASYVSTDLELDDLGDRRKLSDGELADYFDTDAGLHELSEKLASFCKNNRCHFDKILLPPVLGYIRTSKILEELSRVCGCRVGEVLTNCNSVVGYRMTRALYRGLEVSGVTLIRGAVVDSFTASDAEVKVSCTLGLTDQYHPGKKKEYSASALVLATGGFLGGGLEARHTSVWIKLLEEELGKVHAEQLNRNAVSSSGQPVLRMGAAVNSDLTAKNESGCGRVFVCGELLAGFNSANERSGAGVAAATGFKAGAGAAAKV